jgi:serine/threonine protein kinase
MDDSSKSSFPSRLAASGLLTGGQLAEALRAIELNNDEPAPVSDAQLAARLVEAGFLNRWQAEQLAAGRVRFTLGPYRMIDSIGQGGMGQIFKAEHTLMGRIVAVKVLPRHRSSPEAIACFHREIRAQAQLDHENLVRALDAGHDGNVHYLVTEYVPGTDLRRLVRRQGPLDVPTAASIIAQAATGLSHAHAIGLIHRDVKPGNILVTPAGRAKVSDLGLADFFDATVVAASGRRGRIVGTADYLSPEQISSPENLTPASDIYSLGCTLYYAVTGKVPFPGGTTREKIYSHLNLQPIDPRRFNPALGNAFVDVIAQMMAKKPGERLATGEEVAARLAPWASGAPATIHTSLTARAGLSARDAPSASDSSRWNMTPAAPAEHDELPDTVPPFEFEPPGSTGVSDSKSTRTSESQTTFPIFSAEEETRPSFDSREFFTKVRSASTRTIAKATEATGMSAWLLFFLGLAGAIALGCTIAIALYLSR